MKKTKKILLFISIAGFTVLLNATPNIEKDTKETIVKKDNVVKVNKATLLNVDKKTKHKKLNKVKIRYVKKLNQIENCVLDAADKDDLTLCNQYVHNLSNDINKMEQRINKIKKKRYKM